MNKKDIEKLFNRNGTLDSNKTKHIKETTEELYNIYYDNPVCICSNENCSNKTKFKNFTVGYKPFCSNLCHLTSKQSKKKIEEACLEKYGVPNISMCSDGKEMIKNGVQKKYGVDCYFQTKTSIDKNKEVSIYTTKTFVQKAKEIHSHNTYDYSKVEYVDSYTKVTIICPKHGEWETRPNNHLNAKSGCPTCAKLKSNYDIYKNKKTTLYYIYLPDYDLYKIGITQSSVQKRFKWDIDRGVVVEVKKIEVFQDGLEALNREQQILNEHKEHQYRGEDILRGGNTELFVRDILR